MNFHECMKLFYPETKIILYNQKKDANNIYFKYILITSFIFRYLDQLDPIFDLLVFWEHSVYLMDLHH